MKGESGSKGSRGHPGLVGAEGTPVKTFCIHLETIFGSGAGGSQRAGWGEGRHGSSRQLRVARNTWRAWSAWDEGTDGAEKISIMIHLKREAEGNQDLLGWSALVPVVLERAGVLWVWSGKGRGGIAVFQDSVGGKETLALWDLQGCQGNQGHPPSSILLHSGDQRETEEGGKIKKSH